MIATQSLYDNEIHNRRIAEQTARQREEVLQSQVMELTQSVYELQRQIEQDNKEKDNNDSDNDNDNTSEKDSESDKQLIELRTMFDKLQHENEELKTTIEQLEIQQHDNDNNDNNNDSNNDNDSDNSKEKDTLIASLQQRIASLSETLDSQSLSHNDTMNKYTSLSSEYDTLKAEMKVIRQENQEQSLLIKMHKQQQQQQQEEERIIMNNNTTNNSDNNSDNNRSYIQIRPSRKSFSTATTDTNDTNNKDNDIESGHTHTDSTHKSTPSKSLRKSLPSVVGRAGSSSPLQGVIGSAIVSLCAFIDEVGMGISHTLRQFFFARVFLFGYIVIMHCYIAIIMIHLEHIMETEHVNKGP